VLLVRAEATPATTASDARTETQHVNRLLDTVASHGRTRGQWPPL